MSAWITQNNGVKVRRRGKVWEILYQDGEQVEAKTVRELDTLVAVKNYNVPTESIQDSLTFSIPGKPPTSNNAYLDTIRYRNGGKPYNRRVLSGQGTKYKKLVKSHVGSQRLTPRRYQVTLTVYAAWDTKTPKAASPVHGSDIASCEKLLMDALFDTLMPGENRADKWIWSETLNKVHEPDKANHRAVVTIRAWE